MIGMTSSNAVSIITIKAPSIISLLYGPIYPASRFISFIFYFHSFFRNPEQSQSLMQSGHSQSSFALCQLVSSFKSSRSSAFILRFVSIFSPSGVVTVIAMMLPSFKARLETALQNAGNFGWFLLNIFHAFIIFIIFPILFSAICFTS